MKRYSILSIALLSALLASCGGPSGDGQQQNSNQTGTVQPDVKPVESITLGKDTLLVPFGGLMKIDYSISPADASNPNVLFESADPAICNVDKKGHVRGAKIGETTITLTAADGNGAKAVLKVKVHDVPVTSVKTSVTSLTLAPGESKDITFQVLPYNATERKLTFASSNPEVATFHSGKAHALKEGKATLTATSHNGISASIELTVQAKPLRDAYFDTRSLDLYVGDTFTLDPVLVPSGADTKGISYEVDDKTIVSLESGKIKALAEGKAVITMKSPLTLDRMEVRVLPSGSLKKTTMRRTYKDYGSNSVYGTNYSPTAHEANFLVVPVWFTDSSRYISLNKKESVRQDIETAFFGDETSTGWESVKSYYEEESFGRFHLNGEVMPWFDAGISTLSVASSFEAADALVKKAYDHVKRSNPSLDMKDFDRDADGFIDAMVLVYGAPDYSALGNSSYSNLWAYCNWLQDASYRNYECPGPNVFHWASYDFMYGNNNVMERTGHDYSSGDTTYCTIDAHTFIHETGHLLGLEDYYDYSNQYQPAGLFSMQDYNVGGHDPYSVMAYGWAEPYIPTTSMTFDLRPFATSGDLILLTPEWNSIDSPFDEYLLVEYFDPNAGLNAFDSAHPYQNGQYPTGASIPGIRLWHVDARLLYTTGMNIPPATQTTVDPLDSRGRVVHMMSNTYYGGKNDPISVLGVRYADYNILQLIRDGVDTYRPTSSLTNASLFVAGESFDQATYSSQFKNGLRLNSGDLNPWSFTVDKIENGQATVTVTKR